MGDSRYMKSFLRGYNADAERDYLVANPSVMSGWPGNCSLNSLTNEQLFDAAAHAKARLDSPGFTSCLCEWQTRRLSVADLIEKVREVTR